jgi:[ribosomal protein S5]-alanine N-acetyltransferase
MMSLNETITETPRLTLRRWSPADAEAYMELYRSPEMFRWLGDGRSQPPTDIRQVRRRLAERAADAGPLALWAACEKTTGDVIGNCGLLATPEAGGVELVYHIGRPYWGRGYATEAARACLAYGQGPLHLPRIVALVYPENRASIRVLEKIGMRPMGERSAHGTVLLLFEAPPSPRENDIRAAGSGGSRAGAPPP